MKKNIWIGLGLCLMLSFVGCDEIKPGSSLEGKYATQTRVTPVEYSIYMNKQITVYANQITARMVICRNITRGDLVDNEKILAEESVKVMQDVLEEVTITYPPNASEDNREAAITAMTTALEHMKGYAKAVAEGTDVSGYTIDFENDFNQLTGLANLYDQ